MKMKHAEIRERLATLRAYAVEASDALSDLEDELSNIEFELDEREAEKAAKKESE